MADRFPDESGIQLYQTESVVDMEAQYMEHLAHRYTPEVGLMMEVVVSEGIMVVSEEDLAEEEEVIAEEEEVVVGEVEEEVDADTGLVNGIVVI